MSLRLLSPDCLRVFVSCPSELAYKRSRASGLCCPVLSKRACLGPMRVARRGLCGLGAIWDPSAAHATRRVRRLCPYRPTAIKISESHYFSRDCESASWPSANSAMDPASSSFQHFRWPRKGQIAGVSQLLFCCFEQKQHPPLMKSVLCLIINWRRPVRYLHRRPSE